MSGGLGHPIPGHVLQDCEGMAELFLRLHAAKHTGPVVMIVHFAQGHARVVDVPCETMRIPLDNGKKRAHD